MFKWFSSKRSTSRHADPVDGVKREQQAQDVEYVHLFAPQAPQQQAPQQQPRRRVVSAPQAQPDQPAGNQRGDLADAISFAGDIVGLAEEELRSLAADHAGADDATKQDLLNIGQYVFFSKEIALQIKEKAGQIANPLSERVVERMKVLLRSLRQFLVGLGSENGIQLASERVRQYLRQNPKTVDTWGNWFWRGWCYLCSVFWKPDFEERVKREKKPESFASSLEALQALGILVSAREWEAVHNKLETIFDGATIKVEPPENQPQAEPGVPLRYPCPDSCCGNNTMTGDWFHGSCKKRMVINSQGKVWCTQCQCPADIYFWKFTCNGRGTHKAQISTSPILANRIAMLPMLGKYNDAHGPDFMVALDDSLSRLRAAQQ